MLGRSLSTDKSSAVFGLSCNYIWGCRCVLDLRTAPQFLQLSSDQGVTAIFHSSLTSPCPHKACMNFQILKVYHRKSTLTCVTDASQVALESECCPLYKNNKYWYQGEFYTYCFLHCYYRSATWSLCSLHAFGNREMLVFSCRFTLPFYFDYEVPFWYLWCANFAADRLSKPFIGSLLSGFHRLSHASNVCYKFETDTHPT